MDPSPRTPLAPPGAAKTPGPEGDEGTSSPRCLDQGLGLAGRGLYGGRPRCGRAVRLHPGRGAGRGLSAAGSLGLIPGLRPPSCGQCPGRVTRPSSPEPLTPHGPAWGGRGKREGGREGVVGEGLWGPQGRVPRPARAALGRLPQALGRSQPPASRASSLRLKGAPGLLQAWLREADPSCCLHFVSCSAWSVVVVVWVWGAAGQGGSPAATSARGLGPRRPYPKPPGEPYSERGVALASARNQRG